MSNYKDLYVNGIEKLERAGIAEAKLDARLLLEYVCGTDHSTLLAHPDLEVSDADTEKYLGFIDRRAEREPVAYIIGSWSFMGLIFALTKTCLFLSRIQKF